MGARLAPVYLALILFCFCPHTLKGDAADDLKKVQEDYFQWLIGQVPGLATEAGVREYNDQLIDLSLDVFDTQLAAVQRLVRTTQAIDRGQLGRQLQYSYDIFLDTLTTFINNYQWRNFGALNPVSFMEGFYQDWNFIVDLMPFDTKQDYQNLIARLRAYPTLVNQMITRMNKAIELNVTNHNVSMRGSVDQIATATSGAARDSPLFKRFNSTTPPANITQSDWDTLKSEALTAIQQLWDSLNGLKTYIENTYMPNTRTTYGVWGLPRGQDYYRACIKWHLSVDLTPEEVHDTGLREVDRITQLMTKVMRAQGFNGTIREYYQMLKADPQFTLPSAEAILEGYRSRIHNRTYPKLPPLFKDIPSNPVVVKAMPYDGPGGSYFDGSEDGSRPGTFYANVMRVNDTKTYSMMSLTLHETVPGHHLQSIYSLHSGLPHFQKKMDYYFYSAIPYKFPLYTAYIEGWALYSEYLGEEMNVYADDYEMMGRYGDEIFRACRLVVDTGLHFQGWTRERAIQYMQERLPYSLEAIQIEVDRYITWPGQALAYKIGELKIKELRHKAEEAMGSRFNIRDFHSLLLDSGPMPLTVMDTIVTDYISDVTGGAPCVRCISAATVGLSLLLTFVLQPLLG